MSEFFTNVICTAAFVMASAALVIQIALSLKERREEREERERIAARMPHPAPKPDAAKECGVVPPKFDEQPRRKGRYKVYISFFGGKKEPLQFHDLAEFYRFEKVRKCDFSPSKKMDEDKRIDAIMDAIERHFRVNFGIDVRTIAILRKGRRISRCYAEETKPWRRVKK